MANLTRYDLEEVRGCGEYDHVISEQTDGEYVKFADHVEALSASANRPMPKLPDFDMENVRCLESFIAHRACVGAPAWSAWSEVKKFIVAVRQLRQ